MKVTEATADVQIKCLSVAEMCNCWLRAATFTGLSVLGLVFAVGIFVLSCFS